MKGKSSVNIVFKRPLDRVEAARKKHTAAANSRIGRLSRNIPAQKVALIWFFILLLNVSIWSQSWSGMCNVLFVPLPPEGLKIFSFSFFLSFSFSFLLSFPFLFLFLFLVKEISSEF